MATTRGKKARASAGRGPQPPKPEGISGTPLKIERDEEGRIKTVNVDTGAFTWLEIIHTR